MDDKSTVYLIDDDDAVRRTLERSLKHAGYEVEAFASGEAFLKDMDGSRYGCIILDIAMPGMSGLDVQTELAKVGCRVPIIFMTGHGDVPTSVRAIKNGAIEFLEKPFPMDVLLERVEEALKLDQIRRADTQENSEIRERFETLTKREVEVMASLVAGVSDKSNKEVAREIGISYRTVEEYRARITDKMAASSITHLVEMAKVCGIYQN